MNSLFRLLVASITLFLLTFSSISRADTVRMAFGLSMPPWVTEDGKHGILIDLARACLAPSGHELEVIVMPYARRLHEYNSELVDSVSDINDSVIQNEALSGFFTGNLYAYDNTVYALAENNFSLNKISDVGERWFVSWQGAKNRLGEDYALMANTNPRYMEIYRQAAQVEMLLKRRADFIQLDEQIFNYYHEHFVAEGVVSTHQQVDMFYFLGKSPNGFLFKSKKIRDDCVSNFDAIRANSQFKDVIYPSN